MTHSAQKVFSLSLSLSFTHTGFPHMSHSHSSYISADLLCFIFSPRPRQKNGFHPHPILRICHTPFFLHITDVCFGVLVFSPTPIFSLYRTPILPIYLTGIFFSVFRAGGTDGCCARVGDVAHQARGAARSPQGGPSPPPPLPPQIPSSPTPTPDAPVAPPTLPLPPPPPPPP